jgi:hypothetical protein
MDLTDGKDMAFGEMDLLDQHLGSREQQFQNESRQ